MLLGNATLRVQFLPPLGPSAVAANAGADAATSAGGLSFALLLMGAIEAFASARRFRF